MRPQPEATASRTSPRHRDPVARPAPRRRFLIGPILLGALLAVLTPTAPASAGTPDSGSGTTGQPVVGAPATTHRGSELTVGAATLTGDDLSIQATDRSIRCARAGQAAGWSGSNLVTSVAIALAESLCTAGAQNWNGPTSGCPNGSLDRGAWQINDCYHSWVSDSCAYELYCNARSAYTIYGWSGWGAWATYNNGAYRTYLAEAQAGVSAIGSGVYGTVTTGGDALNVRSGPGTSYSLVGTVADGSTVQILCQVHGERVYSDYYGVWTDLWDRIGSGRYVSDGYVYTGSDGQVAPSC